MSTIEDLINLINILNAQLQALRQENAQLKMKVEELKAKDIP